MVKKGTAIIAIAIFAIAAVGAFYGLMTQPSLTPTPTPAWTLTPVQVSNVTVHFIDVGQGDAIFIDTTEKDVLIDGGSKSAGKTVVNYLLKINIMSINILIATHPHADHIGGLIVVMEEFDSRGYEISLVLDSGQKATTKVYQEYMELANKRVVKLAERGQIYQLDNITMMTVLNPVQPLEFDDPNENSIVVRIQILDVSLLFTGDAEVSTEQSILKSGFVIKSTILKVGHHGSSSSTSQAFLEAASPKVGVMCVGAGNPYGHPHQETLSRLKAYGVTVYRTDQHGTIIITSDGKNYSIKTA